MFIRRPSDLGDLVRSVRQTRGLNQQELADRLGTSRWWVNEFEGGKPTARLDLVLRALNELQITLVAQAEKEISTDVPLPASARNPIDIDAIADQGLPARPLSSRGRRRR